MSKNKIFIVYPSQPSSIGDSIKAVSKHLDSSTVVTWEQIDIPGRFIAEGVLEHIDNAEYVVCDITKLSFNVMYEVGYAMGRNKRIIPIVNEAFQPDTKVLQQLGVLDTIGYRTYANSTDIKNILSSVTDTKPIRFPVHKIDRKAPVFVLDTKFKTDSSVRIISRIKKARVRFRSFDPSEQPRLSGFEAYGLVKESLGVVINLLGKSATDYQFNNLRGAFVAGLGHGMDKLVLILQEKDEPVPVDYRDFVSIYRNADEVDKHIAKFAPDVFDLLQALDGPETTSHTEGILANLDIGASAAENEMIALRQYYLATDEFNKVLDGYGRLVVGRKGSGKTALFIQVRDRLRKDKRKVVLDLKPEGHQLKRFKRVLEMFHESVQDHVATAFWEYVLLLEIAYKLLRDDESRYQKFHELYRPYRSLLQDVYKHSLTSDEEPDLPTSETMDFSERMLNLTTRIADQLAEQTKSAKDAYLRSGQVTEIIYRHDIYHLRNTLKEYLQHKEQVWILFDNIDKGWPTRGVGATDILILRALLDGTRKIERFLTASEIDTHTVVFVRNDVYELLVNDSPDRGKESVVSLDWTDTDLLLELLRRRLIINESIGNTNTSFMDAWQRVSISHIQGEHTSDYLLNRSLMRPRNLLNLVMYCKSNAVNLGHSKMQEVDIEKACSSYSAGLANELGFEIRDVFPQAEDILYRFIDAPHRLTLKQVYEIFENLPLTQTEKRRLIEILLWYAFLGVVDSKRPETASYIYDVFYDMRKLKYTASNLSNLEQLLEINVAFWPFLEVRQ